MFENIPEDYKQKGILAGAIIVALSICFCCIVAGYRVTRRVIG